MIRRLFLTALVALGLAEAVATEPVALASGEHAALYAPGRPATAIGWGLRRENGYQTSNHLREVRGACGGDSGGPLLVRDEDPAVGERVRCEEGPWTSEGIVLRYAWHVGFDPVPRGRNRGFTPRGRHAGKNVSCTVTGVTAGGFVQIGSHAERVDGRGGGR